MLKIAYISIHQGPLSNRVKHALTLELNKLLGRENYQLLEYQGPISESILKADIRRFIIFDEVDLFVCGGDRSTKITLEITSRRRHHQTPVVFLAVSNPVELGLIKSLESSKNNAVGVLMSPPIGILPAQLVLRLLPDLKILLLPHRPDSRNGRAGYEAQQAQRYFEQRGVKVTLHPIDQEINHDKIIEDLKSCDAAIAPEASLFGKDIETITKLAKQTDTIFWADSVEAISRGAFFGVKADIEYLGAVAGQQAHKILVEGKHPSDIPTQIIPNSRSLAVNHELVEAKGLSLLEEIEVSFEEAFDLNREMATLSSAIIVPHMNCLAQSVMSDLSLLMRKDNDAHLHYVAHEGWLKDQDEMQAHLHGLRTTPYYKAYIVLDDAGGRALYEHFKEHKVTGRPIFVLETAGHDGIKNWHAEAQDHGIPIVRVIAPPPDPNIACRLIHHLKPTIKKILLPIMGNQSDLPYETHQVINKIQTVCAHQGSNLEPLYFERHQDLIPQIEPLLSKNTGLLFLENNMPYMPMRDIAELAQSKGSVCAAAGLSWARFCPLSVGMATDIIALALRDALKHVIVFERPIKNHTIIFTAEQVYRININQEVCNKMDLAVPPATQHVIDFTTVDPNYSFTTALGLNVLTFAESKIIRAEMKALKKTDATSSVQPPPQKCRQKTS